MYGKELGQTDTVKFLGLIFDTRLTWQTHIKQLKAQCLRSLNVLKYLSNPRTGCHRRLLLRLYQTLIRSRLDYGAPLYGLANKGILQTLETVQTTALRIVTGAFPTSPRLSLCAETTELPMPLHYRRAQLAMNFLTKVSTMPDLPIHPNRRIR